MSRLIVAVFQSPDDARFAADSLKIQKAGVNVVGITGSGTTPGVNQFAPTAYAGLSGVGAFGSVLGNGENVAPPQISARAESVLRLTCSDKDEQDCINALAQMGARKVSVRN